MDSVESFVRSVHIYYQGWTSPTCTHRFTFLNCLTRAKSIAEKPGRNQSRVNRAHERSSSSRPSRTQREKWASIPRIFTKGGVTFANEALLIRRIAMSPKNRRTEWDSPSRVSGKIFKSRAGNWPRRVASIFSPFYCRLVFHFFTR